MAIYLTSEEIDTLRDDDDFDGPSDEFLEILSMPDTDDGLICLLEITSQKSTDILRIASGTTKWLGNDPDTLEPIHGVEYDGNDYISFGFRFVMGDQPESGEMGDVQVIIENVDERLTQLLRTEETALLFKAIVLRRNNLTRPELTQGNMYATQVNITYSEITFSLTDRGPFNDPVPSRKFTPNLHPALF